MAGISKKRIKYKNGKTVIKYAITYRDIKGRQHTAGIFETYREAKQNLKKYDNSQNAEKILTIDEITGIYIESRTDKKRATHTIKNYNYYNNYIIAEFADVKYTRMTSYDWQKWIYKMERKHSSYVADGCFKLLRAAFKYCKKYKKIIENTFEDVETVELPENKHNHFDLDEIPVLLNTCYEKFREYYVLLFTFLASGAREGEIFGLKKCYVNFAKHTIEIAGQYTGKEYKTNLKTKKSRRTLYMFPMWEQVLKEHIESDATDSEFVFHNSEGNPLNPSNVRQRFWLKLLKACDYPENYARMHDLRGSNSDLSLALGLSITYSREVLGHYDEATTLKYYARTNKNMIAEGVEKYDEFFRGLKKCEQNVSKKEKNEKGKILLFPRTRSVG